MLENNELCVEEGRVMTEGGGGEHKCESQVNLSLSWLILCSLGLDKNVCFVYRGRGKHHVVLLLLI